MQMSITVNCTEGVILHWQREFLDLGVPYINETHTNTKIQQRFIKWLFMFTTPLGTETDTKFTKNFQIHDPMEPMA